MNDTVSDLEDAATERVVHRPPDSSAARFVDHPGQAVIDVIHVTVDTVGGEVAVRVMDVSGPATAVYWSSSFVA